jgi:hypothetical protein
VHESRGPKSLATRLALISLAISIAASSSGCASPSVPPRSPGSAASSTSPPPHADRTARTYGWVSVSIGAEATAIAIITSAMMLHENSVREANCDGQKVCTPTGIDANATLSQLGTWNAAAWVVALGGLGVGSYLLWTHPVEGKSQVGVAVDPVGTGLGLGVRSTF